MITVGAMRLPQPEPLDDLSAFLRGLEPDGGYWLAMRRLSAHDHSGGVMGVPVAGGGGGTGADVTISGTEGVTVVESPANTFALGLTASPDANNTVQIRANGIYSASGAIPPEYVTDAELATALGPYATDADLAAHVAAADPHAVYTTATELAAAVTAHEGLANPHPTYATDADLTNHAAAADPHAVYTTATELTTALGPYLTSATATTTYVPLAGGSVLTGLLGPTTTNTRDLGTTALRWRKLWAVDAEFTNAPTVGGAALLTQTTADALFLTPAEGNALYRPISYVTDVTMAGDNGVGVTESPANTFALATKVSPDSANILVLRANGLYAPAAGTDPAITARIDALETSVAALKIHVHELGTFGAGTLAPSGGIP